MGNEKYYDYYKSSAEIGKEKLAEYEPIGKKRSEVVERALKSMPDVIGVTESRNWGHRSFFQYFVFKEGAPILDEKHIKIMGSVEVDGESGYAAYGKCNTKEGNKFNRVMTDVNMALKNTPKFDEWLIEQLDAMRSGLGTSNGGRGIPMLETGAASCPAPKAANILLLRVPNEKASEDRVYKPFKKPKGWRKLTYGQFYDLANPEG